MYLNIRTYTLQPSEHASFSMQWQQLEKKADHSVFLSWPWIQAWLEIIDEPIVVIEATQAEVIVGLSLWCERTRKVFGFIPIKQALLHRTGESKKDQMWIEYNDFLLAAQNKVAIREAMLNFIKDSDLGWKELVIGLSETKHLKQIKTVFPIFNESIDSRGHKVDLSQVKAAYRSEVLSKNTRAQINRSYKMLAKLGEVEFNVLVDKDEIQACLPNIADLHLKRWCNIGDGSGFDNEYFVDFHQSMLTNAPHKFIELSVLSVNDEPIGYLYNYCFEERVYFYLSALTTHLPSKIKVGMLIQALAVEHYFAKGMSSYDFLAGDAQYKRSLTNESYILSLCHFCVDSKVLVLENLLKKIKSKTGSILKKVHYSLKP